MLREERFDTGSVVLNYAADTADGPPLVLLHGVTSRWQSWLNVAPAFAVRWRLYALDLRGHGRSGRVPGAYTIPDYADDVSAFLREVVGTPAVVVGHSLGGIIATAVAAAAPEQVAAVVLEDPPLAAFRHESLRERPEHPGFVATRDLAASGQSVAALSALLAERQPTADAVTLRVRATSISQLDPDVLTLVVEDRARGDYDQDECLRRGTCPTLLLQADPQAGGALGDEDAARALGLLPQGLHVKLPGVEHNVHATAPTDFCRLVRDFLETC
jgi:pimeloyl-ACP methyl ester carboxylesterase